MRGYIGDDRGQLKHISLTSGRSVGVSTKMARSREVTCMCYTGKYDLQLSEKDDIYHAKRQAEITLGRANGIVQAFVTSGLPGALSDACTKYTTLDVIPHRSLKCIGRVILVKPLRGLYDKSLGLDECILVVSDQNEIYVVQWEGSYHYNLGHVELGKWEDEEEVRVPLNPAWLKVVDFKSVFSKEARTRKRKTDGSNPGNKIYASTQEMNKLLNQELIEDYLTTTAGNTPKPDFVKYAWRISLPDVDEHSSVTIHTADVDVYSGVPRLMLGGDNLLLRVFDFTTGTPLFSARNAKADLLGIERSANARICSFIPSMQGLRMTYLVGTDEGALMLYYPYLPQEQLVTSKRSKRNKAGNGKEEGDGTRVKRKKAETAIVQIATLIGDTVDESRNVEDLCLDRRPLLVMAGSSQKNSLKCRCVTSVSKDHVDIAVCDNYGNGRLYRILPRDTLAVYTPPNSRRTITDNLLYRENNDAGIIHLIREGFPYTIIGVRGFRPLQGTPKDLAIHPTNGLLAFGSLSQHLYTYHTNMAPTKYDGNTKKIIHKVYTTTNITSVLLCNEEFEEDLAEACAGDRSDESDASEHGESHSTSYEVDSEES